MSALMSLAASSIAATNVITPTFYLNDPIGNQVNEGTAWDFFITTYGANTVGTTVYWTIDYNSSTDAADFAAVNGSLVLSANPNSNGFVVFFSADRITEGPQTFRIQIRIGSITGPIVGQSSLITINDTSR
jgi:hypothetical protein